MIIVQTACHLGIVQSLTKFFYPGQRGMSYQSRKTQIVLATANFYQIVLNHFYTGVRLHIILYSKSAGTATSNTKCAGKAHEIEDCMRKHTTALNVHRSYKGRREV